MSAMSGESVDTSTAPKTPLVRATAMVYAITGWSPSRRMFLFLTRFEPARAGISPMMLGASAAITALPGGEATVDGQVDASNVPRCVGREEDQRPREVGGFRHAAPRHSGRGLSLELVVLATDHPSR